MLASIHAQRILFLMIQELGRLWKFVAQEVADTRGFFTECNSLYTGFSGTAGDAQFGFAEAVRKIVVWLVFRRGYPLVNVYIAIKNGDL